MGLGIRSEILSLYIPTLKSLFLTLSAINNSNYTATDNNNK